MNASFFEQVFSYMNQEKSSSSKWTYMKYKKKKDEPVKDELKQSKRTRVKKIF